MNIKRQTKFAHADVQFGDTVGKFKLYPNLRTACGWLYVQINPWPLVCVTKWMPSAVVSHTEVLRACASISTGAKVRRQS